MRPFDAHFWIAPGVEVELGVCFSASPPRVFCVPVLEPMTFDWASEDYSPFAPAPQRADFTLTDWSDSGEVAHYDLDSWPRDGWRWLVVNGEIRAERISRAPHVLSEGEE